MSGLYNIVLGQHAEAGILLALLSLDATDDIPRFRDAWWDGQHVVLLTRVGGGNRADYAREIDRLRGMVGYVRDEDWDYDSTYALFYFDVPVELAPVMQMCPVEAETLTARWNDAMRRLEGRDPEMLARVRPAVDNIVDAIKRATRGEDV